MPQAFWTTVWENVEVLRALAQNWVRQMLRMTPGCGIRVLGLNPSSSVK